MKVLRFGGLVAALVVAGCGGGAAGPGGEVRVAAAASLTDAFTELAERYEAENPGVTVTASFGGSTALATQIVEGAPADVFAAADDVAMQLVVDAGLAADVPTVFATNEMVIAVPAGNPAGIRSLADLADPGLLVVQCAPTVPCGRYAVAVLGAAGVVVEPVSWEENVKGVVTKVAVGEADAGLVYASDVVALDGVLEAVVLPEATAVPVRYPLVMLQDGGDAAAAFVAFLRSPEAQAVLQRYGFGPPPG